MDERSNQPIRIAISADEAAIILDSLDTALDIYRQATRDAAEDGNPALATTLRRAADMIHACRRRVAHAIDAAVPGA